MIIRMCLQVPIGTCFLSKSKFLNHHTKLLNFGYLSQIRWVTIGSQIFENAHKQRAPRASSHSSPATINSEFLGTHCFVFCVPHKTVPLARAVIMWYNLKEIYKSGSDKDADKRTN